MLTNLYRIFTQAAGVQSTPTTGQTLFIIGMTLLGAAVLVGLAVLFINIVKLGLRGVTGVLKGVFSGVLGNVKQTMEKQQLVGFAYDPKQDIFYSDMNAWQRKMGYCRIYDEAAAAMNMIIDCEPAYFDYAGKKWLIEFWKGQYGITTGCEVGVYTTTRPNLNIPGVFNGTFYDTAAPADMLPISYTLLKNGKELFRRQGSHWWLTGFKLGEFSDPSELTARISISLKDRNMLNAFVEAMKKTGYASQELSVSGATVSFVYGTPHSAQPYTRSKAVIRFIQKKNKELCDRFNELTGNEKGALTKLDVVSKLDPALYSSILEIGRPKKLYERYNVLQKYLS
jgi:hypothetical protein